MTSSEEYKILELITQLQPRMMSRISTDIEKGESNQYVKLRDPEVLHMTRCFMVWNDIDGDRRACATSIVRSTESKEKSYIGVTIPQSCRGIVHIYCLDNNTSRPLIGIASYQIIEIKGCPEVTHFKVYKPQRWVYILGDRFRRGSIVRLTKYDTRLNTTPFHKSIATYITGLVYSPTSIGFRMPAHCTHVVLSVICDKDESNLKWLSYPD